MQLSDADLNSACLYLKRLIEGLQVEDPQVAGILKDGLVEITMTARITVLSSATGARPWTPCNT